MRFAFRQKNGKYITVVQGRRHLFATPDMDHQPLPHSFPFPFSLL